ncbi:hypothetical protein FKM82_024837 [Ascaphus truei]
MEADRGDGHSDRVTWSVIERCKCLFPSCAVCRLLQDGNEDNCGYTMQKTPIILAKPSAERLKTAPALATAPMEKPIVLMKAREEGKPSPPAEGAALPPTAATVKVEKEGQRPTQPVYQIQNRGMGSAASGSGNVDRKS